MPFAGTITKQTAYHREAYGTLSATGAVGTSSALVVAVGGVLAFAGSLGLGAAYKRSVGGVLAFTGALISAVGQVHIGGVLEYLSGTVSLVLNGEAVGTKTKLFLDISRSLLAFGRGFFMIGDE